MMTDWGPILDALATGPRENGTAGLETAIDWLLATLKAWGIAADAVPWEAHPYRLRLAGVLGLAIGLGYVGLMWKQWSRAALGLAVGGPLALILWLDVGVPLFDVVGGHPQRHVVATLPAAGEVKHRLVFSAHVDTKTDLFDHLVRTPLTLASVPCALLMIVGALWKRARKVAIGAAVFSGFSYFLVSTGGAFVGARSHGAIDDGAGCAVLLGLGQRFQAEPLPNTEVTLIFFSGEELGAEGARAFVRSGRVPKGARVINVDGVGATEDLAAFKAESALFATYAYDPALLAAISAEHQARRGKPLHRTFYSVVTDARAFTEAGIPAVSIASDLPEHAIARNLHSAADQRSLVAVAALDSTVDLLVAVARRLDRGSP